MTLAINGGHPVRTKKFQPYISFGEEEISAANRVMKSGVLSGFMGSWSDENNEFFGGKEVLEFEKTWGQYFKVKHSISVNSASSALHMALKACDVGQGDEVIVSPFSMSVSASAPLLWGAKAIFADVTLDTYNLCPKSIEEKITPNTKAILVVHLFGCPADMDEILEIARKHDLRVIEDASQAPGATYKGTNVGALGDIGVFSLNVHKHIQTGEGGVCTTNDDELALKLQLLRNHSEAVVEAIKRPDLKGLIGFNFRITEIQAAMGTEQVKKLESEVSTRQHYASIYDENFSQYPFIETTIKSDRNHVYYVQAFRFLEDKAGVTREKFLEAVKAELAPVEKFEHEGVQIYPGYIRPLYKLPIFESNECLPNVEKLFSNELFFHDFTKSSLSESDVFDVRDAYKKVCDNIDQLKN